MKTVLAVLGVVITAIITAVSVLAAIGFWVIRCSWNDILR